MADLKRLHAADEDSTEIAPKKNAGEKADLKLESFLNWCDQEDFRLNKKVIVSKAGSCAQYGMIAVEDIAEGECLFQIPRPVLLMPQTCGIAELLEKEKDGIASASGWVPLLISLLYEYMNPKSKWRSYLDLCPDFTEFELPMFWPSSELQKELQGTGVAQAVSRDLEFIEREFKNLVLPFLQKHPEKFPKECQTIEMYKKMVSFVMAYSFTEPLKQADDDDNDDDDDDNEDEEDANSPPMMVPMADILNHVAKHNAHLVFGKDALEMVSTKPIRKGEEVYNTYGQLSNGQLLHMYGFAEQYPHNHNDTVDIPASFLYDTVKQDKTEEELTLLGEKWSCLKDMAIIVDEAAIVVGVDGILTEEECAQMLKVIFMSKAQFQEFKENEGWTEDEGEDSFTLSDIPQLPSTWKKLLCRVAEQQLMQYQFTEAEDDKLLTSKHNLTRRQKWSLYVRHGQRCLLKNLISHCKR